MWPPSPRPRWPTQLLLLVTSNAAAGDKIMTAANAAVTLTGTTATAADLKAIDEATTGLVDASTIISITDAPVAAAKQLLVGAAASVAHHAEVTVALTETSANAGDPNAIDAATTGLVCAGLLTHIQGNMADVNTALQAIASNTTQSAGSLSQVIFANAVSATALNNVVFANSTAINLADVSVNALTLARGPGRRGQHADHRRLGRQQRHHGWSPNGFGSV